MKKGIVMEINDGYLTLLTPDGEFLRARKQNQRYAIGEEIVFSPSHVPEKKQAISFRKRMMSLKSLAVAAIALIIFFGSFLSVYQTNKAYAYVSIDVNPSIELVLNKKMQVLKVTAFNQDGKKIVAHIGDWKKKKIAELTQLLLNEMKKQGYFKDHHLVVISTVRTDKKEANAEKILSENMKEIKTAVKEKDLELTVLNGTPEELEKAHQLGITTGKYKESEQPLKEKKQPSSRGEINGIKEAPKAEKDGTTAPAAASVPSSPAIQSEKANGEKRVLPSAPNASPGNGKVGKQENSNNDPQNPAVRAPGQVKKIDEPAKKAKDPVNEMFDKEIKHESENNRQEEKKADEQGKKTFQQPTKEQLNIQVELPDIQINRNDGERHDFD